MSVGNVHPSAHGDKHGMMMMVVKVVMMVVKVMVMIASDPKSSPFGANLVSIVFKALSGSGSLL
jgi:hypothetical protein